MSKSSVPAPEFPGAASARQFVSTIVVETYLDACHRAPDFTPGDNACLPAVGLPGV
ncbi:MAG TPA: hypothetical protein VD835_10015 [Pyrinomonadaceae bacterium]|nr:hypothetical protein [Pyrinomonadaceae bacterium]